MNTIVLLVSRANYLEKVITALELLECDHTQTNLLCIVDGDPELFLRTRNLVNDTKFNERLTTQLNYPGKSPRFDIAERRRRIAAAHNQAGELVTHKNGYILSIEDDTVVPRLALEKLLKVASVNRAFGMAEGVELGRWGVPYVGAWRADDIYNPTSIRSLEDSFGPDIEKIDAGGLYCLLTKTQLYKEHTFYSENGLGPDINFGIALRQLGYDNFIHWGVSCIHFNDVMGKEITIKPTDPTKIITLIKKSDTKWDATY